MAACFIQTNYYGKTHHIWPGQGHRRQNIDCAERAFLWRASRRPETIFSQFSNMVWPFPRVIMIDALGLYHRTLITLDLIFHKSVTWLRLDWDLVMWNKHKLNRRLLCWIIKAWQRVSNLHRGWKVKYFGWSETSSGSCQKHLLVNNMHDITNQNV